MPFCKGEAPARRSTTKGRRFPAEPLTPAEVQTLLKACSNRAPSGIRNRALLAVLWRAGLRVSEALALRVVDVDLDAGTIRVLHGKGDKARTVGIDPEGCAVVGRWIDRRQRIGLNGRHPLFCTLGGGAMFTSYVRSLLPRLAARAGVEKRVHPHALRHTHAAELASEGVPLNVIQRQLGHSNAATTSRYLDHIAPQQVIAAMRERRW